MIPGFGGAITTALWQQEESQIDNPFRYCGEYLDSETNTYYLRARNYDPTIGRFLSEDTHWNTANMVYGDDPFSLSKSAYVPDINAIRQSTNLYVYCGNNPVIYIDQNGEIFMLATGAAGAVIGGVSGGIYSYIKYGEVRWKDVVGGAAIGGAIGLTGGAATGVLVAGSATASTGAVIAGASTIAVAGGTGATGALAKTVDSLVNNADKLQRTVTVMKNVTTRPYIDSTQTIQQIMKAASPIKDLGTINGLKWVVEGGFNGSKGVYELVINPDTMTILHYVFKATK